VCVCCLGVVHAPVQSTRRTLPPFRVHRSSQRHEKLQGKIEEMEEMLRVEKEVEKNLSVWGVILYDESECDLLM